MTKLPEKDLFSGVKTPRTTTGEMKRALGRLRDFLAELLGEDSSDRETARKAMGIDLSVLASRADVQGVMLDKADKAEVQAGLFAKADREELVALEAEIAKRGTPVGSIDYFAMATPPAGYLKADGAEVGRASYPDLFAAIGTMFGRGDGEKTFNLPDLIGRFPQGSTVPGQKIEAGLPNITGKFRAKAAAGEIPGGAFYGIGNIGGGSSDNSAPNYEEIGFDASKSNRIYGMSETVQPPALTLLPCIKAFNTVTNPGLIDVSALAGEMNAKLGKEVDGKAVRYVTDSFSDGSNWYRRWSDGWVEQGGKVTQSNTIVSLHVPFRDADYTLLVTVVDDMATVYTQSVTTGAYAVTTASFKLRTYYVSTNYDAICKWYACGFAGPSGNG